MNERNKKLDLLKGFAIILVVIGHSIQSVYADKMDQNIVFELIYSFHMPLFMFISGLVTTVSSRSIDTEWLKRRGKSLLIPFVAWMFIPYICSKNWGDFPIYVKNVLKSPDNANWFLYTLFQNACLLWLVYRISKNKNVRFKVMVGLIISLIVLFISRYIRYFGFGLLAWHSVFYFAGHFIGLKKNEILKYKYLIGVSTTIIWICLAPFWKRVDNPVFLENASWIIVRLFNYVIAFSGIGMSMMLIFAITNITKLTEILGFLGKSTIEIYVLQWYFFGIFHFRNEILIIILNVILGTMIPLFISVIFKRNKASLVLFGKNNNIYSRG